MTFAEMKIMLDGFTERERRDNYRAAMIVAAIYNVNRDTKKRNKPYTPAEILGEDKQKPKDMLKTADHLTEFFGGEVRRGE
jgi:hypothetical protein